MVGRAKMPGTICVYFILIVRGCVPLVRNLRNPRTKLSGCLGVGVLGGWLGFFSHGGAELAELAEGGVIFVYGT